MAGGGTDCSQDHPFLRSTRGSLQPASEPLPDPFWLLLPESGTAFSLGKKGSDNSGLAGWVQARLICGSMMETEQEVQLPSPEVPLFSVPSIALASFLGGPLAAGWLVSVNFRRLGEPRSARNALIQGVLATAALLGLMIGLPTAWVETIPGFTLPLLYTGLIWYLAERYQGRVLTAHFARGGQRHSLWRAVLVSLLAALPVAVFLLLAGLVVPMPPPFEFDGEPVAYGEAGDRIYQGEGVTTGVTEMVGRILTEEGVFSDGRIDLAGLSQGVDGYVVEVPVPLSSWSDRGILAGLRRASDRMNQEGGAGSFGIVLVHHGVSGMQRRPLLPEDGLSTGPTPIPGSAP